MWIIVINIFQTLRWGNVDSYIWNDGYQALYVFQRVGK